MDILPACYAVYTEQSHSNPKSARMNSKEINNKKVYKKKYLEINKVQHVNPQRPLSINHDNAKKNQQKME